MRLAIAMAAVLAAACHEIPQDAPKPYAGTEDVKPYAGGRFNGDKAQYEKTMAERTRYQDEYLRTGGATR